MVVDHGLGEARGLGDLAGGHRVEAVAREEDDAGVEQLLARLVTALALDILRPAGARRFAFAASVAPSFALASIA